MLLYSYFRTTKTDRLTVTVLFRMHFLFRYRYGIATLLMMTLLINSTGYAIAHSMVKRWSKASVRAYLLCHKPDTFFEFTLDNHSVVGYDNAEYLEEEQEIRIGEEMYDIFSSRLEQNGTYTVRCVHDRQEKMLRSVCYAVFQSHDSKLPIKNQHRALVHHIIKDSQPPDKDDYKHILDDCVTHYVGYPLTAYSVTLPIYSPPPEA